MSELQDIISSTVARLLEDEVDQGTLERAAEGEWCAGLWGQLEANGLTQPLVPESAGGAGGSWETAFAIAYQAGRASAPVPLAETAVAGWLLAAAAVEVPAGPLALIGAADAAGTELTLRRSGKRWHVAGRAADVPWGRHAPHAVAVLPWDDGSAAVLVPGAGFEAQPAANLAGEPRDSLLVAGCEPLAVGPLPEALGAGVSGPVRQAGALMRSAQMAGASGWVLDETLAYAGDRVQFGRPIGKLQAIQHYLATLASRVAQATIAAEAGFRAMDRAPGAGAELDIAAAKVVVGEAAWSATSVGHQVHGAIGFTREHRLHHATRRLWCWRSEFGSEAYWADLLGRAAIERGADRLWSDLTERQAGEPAADQG